eukprot:TRINITY_DN12519_c0_g1_i1.p1 TRINITY_DN12519_c0_g1~~TRINITY_DN12519_c0_g1_i1.p1  ORF type:complete len:252 (-),score=86.52 TRINITY_DN12519_c0_g1_i1:45-800(-)
MILKEDFVDLKTPSGEMRVYIVVPNDPVSMIDKKIPGIIFWTAIFQRTKGIERFAKQLASRGYVVIVPEIWHSHLPPGTVLEPNPEGTAKGNQLKKEQKIEAWEEDTKVMVEFLKSHPMCNGRVGTIGHCIGGHLVLRAALHPEILAAASFFATDVHNGTLGIGEKADTLDRFHQIQGEVNFFWGRQDPHIPDEGRLKIYTAVQKSKMNYTWHEFNANHSFLMDDDPKGRYDPDVTAQCLDIVFDLFHRRL